MIKAVADSGPFMHLAIIAQVYEGVVTQGAGKPSAQELAAMYKAGVVQILEVTDQQLGARLRHARRPTVSDADVMAVALAVEQRAAVLSDDVGAREWAMRESVPVIGSIGILVQAR